MLAIPRLTVLTDFGTITMVNVTFALVSRLIVLPTIIVAIDRRKEWGLAKQIAVNLDQK